MGSGNAKTRFGCRFFLWDFDFGIGNSSFTVADSFADTGPLVALFDPQDKQHDRCKTALKALRESITTTTPVLAEAFHILSPSSIGSDRLREFIEQGGLSVWFFSRTTLTRAFELMELYADHPTDLADASLVTAAETLGARRVFTIDRNDFETYRVRRGHRHQAIQIVP